MQKNPPDVILSMGVSSESQVEELPENRIGGGRDGNGKEMTPGKIKPNGATTLKTDLPVKDIEASLKKFGDQREVGTSYFDQITQVVTAGKASTTALHGSTEDEQFFDDKAKTKKVA